MMLCSISIGCGHSDNYSELYQIRLTGAVKVTCVLIILRLIMSLEPNLYLGLSGLRLDLVPP